ncbi:MAG: HDIG domain-containing protein [Marinisporobacter sp.]|jgi:putative nucleotidyltransferase with HDIG domain|nr:HDIG domain-containing protein [Marinisporobacter sp.]
MNRREAVALLKKHVKSEQLYRHSMAVEAGMRAYARHFGEDEEAWAVLGILHDVDFEKYPEEHPAKATEMLTPAGFDKDFIDAVVSHGLDCKEMRVDHKRKALSAVDQMSSFIVAVARMRPTHFDGLKAKSVKKKMKDKAFAKAVNRDELEASREALGVEFAEHVDILVQGLIEHEKCLQAEGFSLLG